MRTEGIKRLPCPHCGELQPIAEWRADRLVAHPKPGRPWSSITYDPCPGSWCGSSPVEVTSAALEAEFARLNPPQQPSLDELRERMIGPTVE